MNTFLLCFIAYFLFLVVSTNSGKCPSVENDRLDERINCIPDQFPTQVCDITFLLTQL